MLRKIVTNPFFVFPILSCLVFWPLTFHLFTLKNDALTYYYPVRTLISDALNNGEFPLWTPYINMGYPLHADMQSGAWNPVIWIFSLLSGYSLQAFHYELLLYISFAGIGFYFLCRNIGYGKTVAFCMALAYQFSGFTLDSIQFFNCISAACYLPFIILFFRKTIFQKQLKDTLLLAFFLFLLFTGGYPSLFIITGYTIITYLIYLFLKEKNKNRFLKEVVPLLSVAAFLFVILSLPAILSFVGHLDQIARGKGQSLSVTLENSMNPSTTLSLLSPFSTTASDGFLNSSILMRSIYIGIIPLLFLVFALFNNVLRQYKEQRFFLVMAIIMLGMSWGEFFFLRQIAYYLLPLMDSFRHPALFRLFTIFFLLLIAGAGMQSWANNEQTRKLNIKKIIITILIISIVIPIISFLVTRISIKDITNDTNWLNVFYNLNFTERYLLQLPFIAAILLCAYYVLTKKKKLHFLIIIVAADFFFASQFNMPVTVIGVKNFAEVNNILNRNPEKFPIPDSRSIEGNMEEIAKNEYVASPLPYVKKIGRTDVFITPGNLISQDSFYYSPIKAVTFKNPVIYFADSVKSIHSSVDLNYKVAYVDSVQNDTGYTSPDNTDAVRITKISANSIIAESNARDKRLLILQQNYYPGWQVFIDGKETVIKKVNISLIGVNVPAGKHTMRFNYHPSLVIKALYLSVVTSILMIIVYLFLSFSKRRAAKHQKGNKIS